MGFTVEDMLIVGADKFEMKMIAGKNGWANSISWLLMVEDLTIISNFRGKELAVTTCLGFDTEDKLLELVSALDAHHAAGLILNTGGHVMEVPYSVSALCEELDLPLLTVPWSVILSDMVKELSIRIFLQGSTDEQISAAFIKAIEHPADRMDYEGDLLANFDIEGAFQVIAMSTDGLASMDTVERKRLGYRLQIYLEQISHNGHFFYYNGCFLLIANAVEEDALDVIIEGFKMRMERRMPESRIAIGIGSRLIGITQLHISYERALIAVNRALIREPAIIRFDEMGIDRLLHSVRDELLIKEMGEELLAPLLDYDKKHDGDYEETLYNYLKYDGSIQAVGEAMYIHRNTITYRMNKIKELIGTNLETEDERLPYELACRIIRM